TINDINEALANGEDHVTQMEATKTSGMKAMNDRTTQAIEEITTLVNTSTQEIANLKDNTITELDDKAIQIKNDIDALNEFDTSNWQKYHMTDSNGTIDILKSFDFNIDADSTGSKSFYVTTSANGPKGVSNNGFVTLLDRTLNNKKITYQPYNDNRIFIRTKNSTWGDWKEISKENDPNRRISLGALDNEDSKYDNILNLPGGIYECVVPQDAFLYNAPLDPNGNRYIAEIDVKEGTEGRKQITLISSYNNTEYRTTLHTDGDFRGWQEIQTTNKYDELNSDTGWKDWETMNGATRRNGDDPLEIGNEYRIRKVNGVKIAHLRIHVNNVTTQTVIGKIPQDITTKYQEFLVRTPVTKTPATVKVDVDGTIKLFLNTNDIDSWKTSDYIRGESSWIIDE